MKNESEIIPDEHVIEQEKKDIKLINPDLYLRRIVRKSTDVLEEKIEKSIERLGVPLKKVDYKDIDTVEVSTEDVRFNFSYSLPRENLRSKIINYVEYLGGKILEDSEEFSKWKEWINKTQYNYRKDLHKKEYK